MPPPLDDTETVYALDSAGTLQEEEDTRRRQVHCSIRSEVAVDTLQDETLLNASPADQTTSEAVMDTVASSSATDKKREFYRVNDTTEKEEENATKEKEEENATKENDEELMNEERRCTLSPSKAALLQIQGVAVGVTVSRRDTVSPEALKSLLRADEMDDELKKNSVRLIAKDSLETSEAEHFADWREEVERLETTMSGSSVRRETCYGNDIQDSPARSTRSKTTVASKRPRSGTTKTVSLDSSIAKCGAGISIADTSDSMNELIFAPNLLEQDAVRRTTLDPIEAAAVVLALEKEARRLSNSALEMEGALNDENYCTEQRKASKIETLIPSQLTTKDKEVPALSKKSNTPPNNVRRKKSPTASRELIRNKSPSPVKAAKSRKSSSPAKDAKGTESLALTKSDSKRRKTVDPSDALVVLEGMLQLEQTSDRRQTIDEDDLNELTSTPGSILDVGTGPATDLSRKRASDLDACEEVSEKRVRSTNDDHTVESMDIDSPLHSKPKLSLHAKNQKSTNSSNQNFPDEPPPSRILKPLLVLSPSEGPSVRTPLKGILSARKLRQNDASNPVQTTPNKSVNFGPSQGAEFNHGSPSTSMTPMLPKDALRLFPLESPSSLTSPDEESDDVETSLNTSILDKADSLDEEEPMKVTALKSTQLKKSGFDLLQPRRNSMLALKSTGKSRRRQSMRGYSPLDAQTGARRRRRQTINVIRQASSSGSAMTAPSTANENLTSSSRSPSSKSSSSFFRASTIFETSRMSYVDSSASSDTVEDMEITGEYSHMLESNSNATEKQSKLVGDQFRDEDTAEFSLSHLLAESSVYVLSKSVQDPDHADLPGSLGDLVNEVEFLDEESMASDAFRRSSDNDAGLDPIQEKDETMTSPRGQSMMSLDPNESAEEDTGNFGSLKVNLKSKFDRVSADGEAKSHRATSPEILSVHLVTMQELLASVALNEQNARMETNDAFFGEEAVSLDNQLSKNVKFACAYDICLHAVERRVQDISSWSKAVSEELSSLLEIKAPAIFSPETLDDADRGAIQKLYVTETMVAQSGWCQLQAQVEKQLTSSLSIGANMLANDVKLLKDNVVAGALKRQNDLAAVKAMIDREEQMGLLLDAIEEQQGAHDEYETAVKELEKECSSLSLEESVLQSRLKVVEGRAAELEPVTSEAASLFEQEVLATEEMLVIQESMSMWKICEATASVLRLSAQFEDVLFDVEICVDVHVGSTLTGGTSASIKTNESLKYKERSMYLPYESDVVLVLQRLLLDPHYISRIADESAFGDTNYGHILSKLQILEHFINRSFRLLRELRELSTRFAMRYSEEDSTLWVDFLNFLSAASRIDAECVQFSVGFSLLPVYPYTDYQTAVRVSHGQVSCDAVTREIELVSRQEPKYFTRVCRQLHESFVR